jgi:hypothetical protein
MTSRGLLAPVPSLFFVHRPEHQIQIRTITPLGSIRKTTICYSLLAQTVASCGKRKKGLKLQVEKLSNLVKKKAALTAGKTNSLFQFTIVTLLLAISTCVASRKVAVREIFCISTR